MDNREHDLLGLQGVSAERIQRILDTAATMKKVVLSEKKKTDHLSGRSVVTMFFENSTRTRSSFELAAKYMSATTVNMSMSASSVQKGENLIDTGATLDMMGTDIIIMRHPMSGACDLLARNVHASVINAGDGLHEHPTQALLDLFTIQETLGEIKGKTVAIIGDILHSRVARSNAFGLSAMGAKVKFFGPQTLLFTDPAKLPVTVCENMEEAIYDADIIMLLRIQKERQNAGLFPSEREYAAYYGVGKETLKMAKKGAVIMHPGPVNRGVELQSAVADGEDSVIRQQVQNGVAIRMAVMHLLANEGGI